MSAKLLYLWLSLNPVQLFRDVLEMKLSESIFSSDRGPCVAILFEEQKITYRELNEAVIKFGHVVNHLKIPSGDRVAILLNDSPEFVISFMSICSSGTVAVPVNMGLRVEEQLAILRDCGARTAVAEADAWTKLCESEVESLTDLQHVMVVERNTERSTHLQSSRDKTAVYSLNELMAEATTEMVATQIPPVAEDQAAFILYTSGSTGEPKGAVHRTSDIYYTNSTFCREVLRLQEGDRLFSSSRLPFAYGLGNALTFPLLNGVTTVLCREKPTPEVIARILQQFKPTIFFGVPVIYSLLLDHHARVEALDCSSLRLCVSAGEALPARIGRDWEKTFGLPILDGIGSTEMLHMWMSNLPGEVRYGSSGRLLEGYRARLRDSEGNATPDLQEGNLWVSGGSAAIGYWQRPEATAGTFVDGWVRTGDLYRRDADGYWYHMGRADDCFKSSGQWVSPVEVEDVLLRYPDISRAAVVEAFDEQGLPCGCAFVIKQRVESDAATLEAELREHCRRLLPRHKQPRRYVVVNELPYTATGKIQRFRLRAQLRQSV